MNHPAPSRLDAALAHVCSQCPLCRAARRKQRGLAYQIVRRVESKLCPCCRAYARVHGRKAHEPHGSPAA